MLPTLRVTTTRAFPRYVRSIRLNSGPSERDESTYKEAVHILGSGEVAPPPLSQPPPPPTLTARITPAFSKSVFFDVPPADDPLLKFLTTSIMTHGHGSRAAKMTSECLLHIHTLTRAPPLPILREAIDKASPAVRTMNHRNSGKNVMKPRALSERQRTKQGIKWILDASEAKPGMTFPERLARELIAVIQGNSSALTKKLEVHKLAMVNRGGLPSRV
ncbi:ribosomal protein S7 domain-containing protein [Crucibulum laeve]|uniref:Ribosomal protein S7 domain-containing protein n=1 Tax=Crucibulum laeve TaxID=68775 RepID=A0A5C3LSC5_9AGAR|nr:ribosomal protein S7 domain-containing protein [Crucibulum laeve]